MLLKVTSQYNPLYIIQHDTVNKKNTDYNKLNTTHKIQIIRMSGRYKWLYWWEVAISNEIIEVRTKKDIWMAAH